MKEHKCKVWHDEYNSFYDNPKYHEQRPCLDEVEYEGIIIDYDQDDGKLIVADERGFLHWEQVYCVQITDLDNNENND